MIPVKPCGFYVLVEMDKFEEKTESGIIIATVEQTKREQGGVCVGTIVAFGPIAYKGFKGCDSPADWGVNIGDKFKTHRYAGWEVDGHDNFRLIQDSDITATIEEEANE